MSDLRAKVAYLHGLAEGLDVDTSSAEGRVLASMIDLLGDMAEAIDDVHEAQDELVEYMEDVDQDLSALEEEIYEDESEIAFIPEEEPIDLENGVEILACPECGESLAAVAGERDEEEFDVLCPVCGCSLRAADEADHHIRG